MSTVDERPAMADNLVRAAELMIVAQLGSPRMLARKMGIALDEVEVLLNELELLKVVGKPTETGTRPLLVSSDELEQALKQVRAHAARQQLIVDTEALDEAHGGDVVLRGGLGVAELHPDRETEPGPEPQHLFATPIRETTREVAPRLPAMLVRPERAKRVVQHAGAVVATCGRVTARAVYTVGQGGVSWSKRAGDAATFGVYRRAIRAAEAANDREAEEKWAALYEKAKDGRTKRLKEKAGIVLSLIGLAVFVSAALFALVTLAGALCWAFDGGYTWTKWWNGVFDVLDTTGTAIRWATWIGAVATVPATAILAYREGKRAGRPPRWLVTRDEQLEMESVIDERMVSLALSKVRIPELTTFFKDGGFLEFLVIPRKDGDGTYTQVKLCPGVTADMVVAKRDVLAGNLHRAPLECWPTQGDAANILDLWVADKGVLSKGAGEWPLLHDGTVDVFEGVPFGESQRGAVVLAPLFENNWLIGGRPGQGKSNAARVLLLGAALDPTAELWLYVMGESPDFAAFQPRLSRYAMGMDDSVAAAALQGLRDALVEMERRGKVLSAQPGGPPKISRKLADKPALGLHPLIINIDECHELYQHPEYGKEAEALAVRLIKRGRKYGIILLQETQSPTRDSIPREVTRNVSCGVAYSVADHVANDGLLGTGKYKLGIRATELRMNVDRGTCVTVGVTDNAFELIRTYYVPLEDGRDDVTPVVARAMDGVKELRRTGEPAAIEATPVDHLRDILEALRGEPRVRTAVLLGRLIEANAETYEPWSFRDLKKALGAAPVRKYGGDSVVYLEDVQEALRDREDEDE